MRAHLSTVAVAGLCGLCLWNGGLEAAPQNKPLTLATISTRADMVSDGNVLVEIAGAGASGLAVNVNGRDVTSAFRPTAGRVARGRVEGLPVGRSTVTARFGSQQARLEVVNHPRTGPVFSGPHQTPFICQTVEAGLGAPLDANCSANTQVVYVYRTTEALPARGAARGRGDAPPADGRGAGDARGRGAPPAARGRGTAPDPAALPAGFKLFPASGPRPTDLATTTTTDGRTVDYIVRRERGTINRAVYEIAFLHVPGQPLPDPWTATPGWNNRLVYTFGGGCAAGYRQGPPSNALNDGALSGGYAVAASSLNVFGTNCDDVISAESMMMVKEYFIEQFGLPVYTIGNGGSGGSMQQHLIAQNYPGLLDGLTPTVSFPDGISVWASSADCSVIARAMEGGTESWTEEQKKAVSGFPTWEVCGRNWARSNLQRAASCNSTIPRDQVYDPVTNPKGTRCANHDNQSNVYGRDPRTGATPRPLDNVGVQYGLVAFNEGKISAAQFVELNERAGGHSPDGTLIAERTVADRDALRLAYSTGRINMGGGSLGSIPIIDARGYSDPTADIHDSYRSFVTRARIAAANNGRADNHVILRTPGTAQLTEAGLPPQQAPFNAIRLMDRWLAALGQDRSADAIQTKIVRARPAELSDGCWSLKGERIVEPAVYGAKNRCNDLYLPWGDPRIAAGAPLADNVLKCTLKPIDPKDYNQVLSSDQMAKLRQVFPTGVCDYSKAGVEQTVPDKAGWKTF